MPSNKKKDARRTTKNFGKLTKKKKIQKKRRKKATTRHKHALNSKKISENVGKKNVCVCDMNA